MAPPKRPLKPHIRRQLREAALAANPTRDPAQDFTVQGYEATLIKGRKDLSQAGLMLWDGVIPAGIVEDILVDRHDILHLLRTLPEPGFEATSSRAISSSTLLSPTPSEGFSDLPSDAEDTFFFSSDEAQDYQRGKKRRRLEVGREDRMKALEVERTAERAREEQKRVERIKAEEEAEQLRAETNAQEPPADILHTMRHTLTSLLASPNPQILELRILTHHGSDPRFAFMRADGRWRAYWEGMKADAMRNGGMPSAKLEGSSQDAQSESKRTGLGGLMGAYDDSDEESEGDQDEEPGIEGTARDPTGMQDGRSQTPPDIQGVPPPLEDAPLPPTPGTSAPADPEETATSVASEQAKAARRAKAKEWAEKRKITS